MATILTTSHKLHAEQQGQRRRQRQALLLVLPLLAFILVAFAAPIASMLYRSVYNPALSTLIPKTAEALSQWDGQSLPDAATRASFASELQALAQTRQAGTLATAINRHYPGATSTINQSARFLRQKSDAQPPEVAAQWLMDSHADWEKVELWRAMRIGSQKYTSNNFLTALDLERTPKGELQARSSARIYVPLFVKTFGIALSITLICALLGYPLAFYMAQAKERTANLLLLLILLPFLTSLLVRTTAWIALLQTEGLINNLLLWLGWIQAPLELLYTRFSTIIAMTHILLPFMVLPLYSVMRGINPDYAQAALSLGSHPLGAFCKVYFPLSRPGLQAGALLVFIISIGYYITPALVGGTDGQLIANLIAFHMQQSGNWGLAAALGSLLLFVVLLLYWIYDRLVGSGQAQLV